MSSVRRGLSRNSLILLDPHLEKEEIPWLERFLKSPYVPLYLKGEEVVGGGVKFSATSVEVYIIMHEISSNPP
ncbi:MAG: hypothetical protein WBD99_10255 [Thermodesulfobacteriota bacterium]